MGDLQRTDSPIWSLIVPVLVVTPTSMLSISYHLSVDFHVLGFNDPVFFSEVSPIFFYLLPKTPRPDFNFFFYLFTSAWGIFSSPTRDRTCTPCIGSTWDLNHWTIRKVPPRAYFKCLGLRCQSCMSAAAGPDTRFQGFLSCWAFFSGASLLCSARSRAMG